MSQSYLNVNAVVRRVWDFTQLCGAFAWNEIKEQHIDVIQTLFAFVFLGIYYFYSRFILSALTVFCFAGFVFYQIKEGQLFRLSFFYVIFLLWFIFSSLWTGPEYYAKCVWREIRFGNFIYLIDGAQIPLLFFHVEDKNIMTVVDYAWILNFAYPNEFILMNCIHPAIVFVKVFLMIIAWNAFGFEESFKRRCVGMLSAMEWEAMLLLFVCIVIQCYRKNGEKIYNAKSTLPVKVKEKKKSKKIKN